MKKGQVSVEYIIIIGIILVVTIPLFYYAVREPSRSIKLNQASDTVEVLARKADSIYALGPGSRDYVWISLPGGIDYSLIQNKSILLRLAALGDIVSYTRANVTGYLPITPGTYRVVVENLDSLVYIGPINDTEPPLVIATAPSGTILYNNPELSATTNEPAVCKYSTADMLYENMPTTFIGAGIAHTSQLTGQSTGPYSYYVRCRDKFNNTMTTSALINFTITNDATLPLIRDVNATPRKVTTGNTICVNATVTDNTGIDKVWAMLTSPLTPPYNPIQNFTLTDTGTSCGGGANDNIYGGLITMQVVGDNYVNTVFANDTSGNLNFQSPYPNILINVTSLVSVGPGQGLTYIPVSLSAYIQSPSTSFSTADSAMSTTSNVTIDVTDDDKNTPPSARKFKWSSGSWEGFTFTLTKSPSEIDYISIRLKVVDSDVLPYNLTIYTYTSDLNTVSLTNTTTFPITAISQSGINRGFNEVMITDMIKSQPANSIIKIRIVPSSAAMLNKVMHISEADFGII